MKNKPRVGQILTELMKTKNIHVTELARRVNLPQPTVYRIAAGICENPHLSSLKPIANFFSITINQLRGLDPLHLIDRISRIPLLTWKEIPGHVKKSSKKTSENTLILTDADLSSKAFALRVEDSSLEPVFLNKTILILDPEKPPKHLSYILVQQGNSSKPVVRQFVLNEKNRHQLKTLHYNKEKLSNMKKTDKIIGTLIQTKVNFYEH